MALKKTSQQLSDDKRGSKCNLYYTTAELGNTYSILSKKIDCIFFKAKHFLNALIIMIFPLYINIQSIPNKQQSRFSTCVCPLDFNHVLVYIFKKELNYLFLFLVELIKRTMI